jgi:hypothetical protein
MTPEPASPDRRYLCLIPLAAGVAVLPLIVHGCSCGHDFDFHLLNWMEAARQFSHGNLHPHWAFSPAFNAGEPRFVFYPPLSWTLGALLGLLLTHLPKVSAAAGWTAAPVLFTWIALTASGCTMVRLARAYTGANAALLATTIYLANPYMLFTAYERTAYAELLAAAWIPLLLDAILREKVTIRRIALPVALLWLTNVPAAVIGSYTLALLVTLRILSMHRKETAGAPQLALKAIAGFALGLALAAFYIVPAAYQSRFVQIAMATIAGMRIDRNFLFEHTGTSPDDLLHDQVLHTASLIAGLLLISAAVALASVFLQRKRPSVPAFPTVPLAILTAGVAFLLTPLSAPIWNHAPEAAFLQFPWRLLLIVAPIFALALAAGLSRLALRFAATSAAVLALATALALPAYHFFRQPCDPADTAPARLTLFQSNAGTDPTDEYTPTTADNDELKPNNPPYWLAPNPNDGPLAATPIHQLSEGSAVRPAPGPASTHLALNPQYSGFLILNLRDYPAWRITLNGALDLTRTRRPDGLVAIPIQAGPSTLDVHYAHTLDQTLGDVITLLAFLFFLLPAKPQIQNSR